MKKLFLFALIFSLVVVHIKAQNSFIDSRDGTEYSTVTIGTQTWMAENLKYLPDVVGPSTFSNTSPYYYVYGYDGTDVLFAKATANYNTYGVLYNWTAAMAGASSSDLNPSGVQGVCPEGWHLPSDFEFLYLTFCLGGDSIAGGKLKEAGTLHWVTPNTGATNESGFTALPGGFCDNVGAFYDITRNSIWWTTSEFNSMRAYYYNIIYSSAYLSKYNVTKDRGHSVRCVKNSENSIEESDNKIEIFVYPNPTKDKITIYSPTLNNPNLKLFDLSGRCLFNCTLKNNLNEIQVNDLPNGLYLIQIYENYQTYYTKFVISK